MNLKQCGGDISYKQYGGTFATKKLSNGDFDYWLFVELTNMEEATGDTDTETYMISIRAVSPTQPSTKTKESALYTLGLEKHYNDIEKMKPFEMAKILDENGIGAVLFSEQGNNADKLFKTARKQCEIITSMFGFYMDKRLNLIGNTGWDFIKGEIGFKKEVQK